ncbi:unnamed protein product [Cuscuta campestris]|uniref:Uncharacterized protein n=1 Tax=Cuscuta campestris TaxID=132261 RepID=A0A484NBC4_9ASTE|nr:unnamed protein product [Cuscuta campestris]
MDEAAATKFVVGAAFRIPRRRRLDQLWQWWALPVWTSNAWAEEGGMPGQVPPAKFRRNKRFRRPNPTMLVAMGSYGPQEAFMSGGEARRCVWWPRQIGQRHGRRLLIYDISRQLFR